MDVPKLGHRIEALASWQHHYNWHRAHSAIGGIAPMARLPASRNNLLTLHS
jgi:transposase InsO family protein